MEDHEEVGGSGTPGPQDEAKQSGQGKADPDRQDDEKPAADDGGTDPQHDAKPAVKDEEDPFPQWK